jgi:hypothetical protein
MLPVMNRKGGSLFLFYEGLDPPVILHRGHKGLLAEDMKLVPEALNSEWCMVGWWGTNVNEIEIFLLEELIDPGIDMDVIYTASRPFPPLWPGFY